MLNYGVPNTVLLHDMKQYAISDIHGCNKTFLALLDKIAFSKADTLYLLGDHIDRGVDSKGVLDTIFKLRTEGYAVHCLRGNHDQMLLDALETAEAQERWLKYGGKEALQSFGCKYPGAIPALYLDFMSQLDFVFEVGPYILVHAGLNFQVPAPLQDTTSMLWIRKWYADIDYQWLGDRIILHGHTPLFGFELEEQHRFLSVNRYLDIDCGCVYTENSAMGMGRLCAFDMTNQSLTFQVNVDRARPKAKQSTFS